MDALRKLRTQDRVIKSLTRELEECHKTINTQKEKFNIIIQEEIDKRIYLLQLYNHHVVDMVCLIICILIILFV